jgi:nitroreductase/NAD-dependent dihydropyrimidine dehydrogenase PreA subunit
MSLFVVDREKCLRDGFCVDECPRFLIAMEGDDACPAPVEGADARCINCGHCVAVCPVGALTLRSMSPAHCADVRPELLPSAAQAEQFLRSRRSIRTFEERSVPRDVLARLLDIARYAPSGSNRQPVEWLVIYDTGEVRRMAQMALAWLCQQSTTSSYADTFAYAAERGLDVVCRGAPHIVIAHTPEGRQTDGAIALTYLELGAYALGLGACWSGFAHSALNGSPALREMLGLATERVICGVMLLGYPKYAYPRVPLRNAARVIWR